MEYNKQGYNLAWLITCISNISNVLVTSEELLNVTINLTSYNRTIELAILSE